MHPEHIFNLESIYTCTGNWWYCVLYYSFRKVMKEKNTVLSQKRYTVLQSNNTEMILWGTLLQFSVNIP
jgi:hypothetical protein